MSALDELRRRVAPPAVPDPPVGDWAEAERGLGTPLPADFKRLVEAYGSGELCAHLHWFNPFHERPMRAEVEGMLAAYRQVREVAGDELPWPEFPTPGGLLPWGRTGNREDLYWIAEGPPDSWAILGGDLPDTAVYRMTTTEFVLSWIDAALDGAAVVSWPELQPGVDPFFRPLRRTAPTERLTIHFAASTGSHADRRRVVLRVFRPAKRQESGIDVMGRFTRIRTDHGWELGYRLREPDLYAFEGAPAQMLDIALPPDNLDAARDRVVELSLALGAPVTRAVRGDGSPIWPNVVQPG